MYLQITEVCRHMSPAHSSPGWSVFDEQMSALMPVYQMKKAASRRRFVDSQAWLAFHAQRDEFICKKCQCVIRIVDEDETSIGISMCTCIDI